MRDYDRRFTEEMARDILEAFAVFAVSIVAMTCRRKLLHCNRMGPWMKR